MKKLVLTSVCALAVTGVALAQGTVNWGSVSFSYMTAQTNSQTYSFVTGGGSTGSGAIGAAGGTASLGTGFYYALLYKGGFSGSAAAQPTSLGSLNGWSNTSLLATNANTAGRLGVMAANTGASVPWDNGTTNNIMIVGWSANLGTDWGTVSTKLNNWGANAISGAFFGTSATGYINPLPTGTVPGATLFGNAATSQGLPINSLNTQLYLLAVPEPGTMALAALGGVALLMFRRKK